MARASEVFKKVLKKKADRGRILAGMTGNFTGQVRTGRGNYIFVRTGGAVLSVYNDLVPEIPDIGVFIEESEPGNRQWRVSGTRATADGSEVSGTQLHHLSHEWMAAGAGNDVVYIHIRQFLPLRVGPLGGMVVNIYPGTIISGGVPIAIEPGLSGYDLTGHKPSTSGKARWVLVCISKAGTVTFVDGSDVDIANLPSTNPPAGPSGCFRLAAIRMYYGQAEIMEARIPAMNDIWDLRIAFSSDHHGAEHLEGGNDPIDFSSISGVDAAKLRGRTISSDTPSDGYSLIFESADNLWRPMPISSSVMKFSVANLSNPPTETELITAIGTPDENVGIIIVLNDSGQGANEYLIVSDGGHYLINPVAKAATVTPTLSLISTTTIASESGYWIGRAAVEDVNGVLVLIYQKSTGHAINDGALHIRFSSDFGSTWTAEDKFTDGSNVTNFPMTPSGAVSGQDAGEPWLMIAPNGNLILHMWCIDYAVANGGSYQSVSTDGGKTWSVSAKIDFTGLDADDNRIFSTDDHFVLDGVIYAGARIYYNTAMTPAKNILIKSTDNGSSWAFVSDVSDYSNNTQEMGLEYVGNNRIVAILRSNADTATFSRFSDDLGLTWGTLTDITSTIVCSGRQRIKSRAHLKGRANWWTDSVLVMCGFTQPTSGASTPRRNAIWISIDRGVSWAGPLWVDSESADAGYGDLFYDKTNKQFAFISYQGTTSLAVLKQYKFTIAGI